VGSGHAYELGVGKVRVRYGQLPSVGEMEALFRHKTTRFIGSADRDIVSQSYLELRRKLYKYDEERVPRLVRFTDELYTSDATAAPVLRGLLVCVMPLGLVVAAIVVRTFDVSSPSLAFTFSLFAVVWTAGVSLPSRIVRAHLAAALGYRTRGSLQHTLHCSLLTPPFRKLAHAAAHTTHTTLPREPPQHATAAQVGVPGELHVPACFLPRALKPQGSRVTPISDKAVDV